jgi:hypothetical protein
MNEKVSSGDNVANDDKVDEHLECEILDTNEKMLAIPADPAAESAENNSANTDSLLSDIAQELSEQEPTGPMVNDDWAAMLNKRWATKLSNKKLSDKLELIQRPENCSGLIVPRVNSEIWSNLDKFSKRRDLRASNVQKSLAKAGSLLIYNTNTLLQARQKGTQVDPTEFIKSIMEILGILGHAFVDLSHHRREAIKPTLNKLLYVQSRCLLLPTYLATISKQSAIISRPQISSGSQPWSVKVGMVLTDGNLCIRHTHPVSLHGGLFY